MLQVDYFERAKRIVEVPRRQEQYKEKLVDDEQFHHEQETKKVSVFC